jgi:zinc transporter ZupT
MHNTKALRTITLALGLQFWFLGAVHQRCVLSQMKKGKGNSMSAGHLDIMLSFSYGITNVIEEMHLMLWNHERDGNRVYWSITPSEIHINDMKNYEFMREKH